MYFEKWELKTLCIDNHKEHYIRFIEKYLKLSVNEKMYLWEEITIHNFLKRPFWEEDKKWYQKLWEIVQRCFPWKVREQNWHDAFMFFYEWEEKQVELINFRKGVLEEDECK